MNCSELDHIVQLIIDPYLFLHFISHSFTQQPLCVELLCHVVHSLKLQ